MMVSEGLHKPTAEDLIESWVEWFIKNKYVYSSYEYIKDFILEKLPAKEKEHFDKERYEGWWWVKLSHGKVDDLLKKKRDALGITYDEVRFIERFEKAIQDNKFAFGLQRAHNPKKEVDIISHSIDACIDAFFTLHPKLYESRKWCAKTLRKWFAPVHLGVKELEGIAYK